MFGIKNVLKQMTIKWKPNYLYFLFLFFILCIDLLLFHMEYENYKEKYIIAAKVLEQYEKKSTAELAADLFKNYDPSDRMEWLNQNGFPFHYNSFYYRTFLKHIAEIVIFSILFYFLLLFSFYYLKKTEKAKHNHFLNRLEQLLSNIRNGTYQNFEYNYGLIIQESERFFMELESFLSFYERKEEEIKKEKESVKSLISDISHQLKTPFSALKTSFEILKREDLEKEGRIEFFVRYQKQLDAMELLLQDLIQVSRLESGIIEIKRENACLFETLVEAVNRIYLHAEEKQIDIELEAEKKLQLLQIPHDTKWLCEAILNILENAVKYSPNHSKIIIRMEQLVTFLRIEVEDQGIGVPREECHKIFQRFYRGCDIAIRNQTGSGIGLYLTREIIAKHHGTISVCSSTERNKKGSKFIVQLPYTL